MRIFKRIIALVLVIATLTFVLAGCKKKNSLDKYAIDDSTEKKDYYHVAMAVEDYGIIIVKLDAVAAPKTVANFVKLVREGFYNGLTFHRVIEGFMIQGGDPYSRDTAQINMWGQGGPGYTVPAEFVNEYWHKKGAIAAARKGDMANPRKASSGSQFYIVHDENNCLHLDGQYTIFGEVTEGLEVIDRIAGVATDPYDRPYEDVLIISIKALDVEPEEAPADAAQPSDNTVAE